VSGAVLGADFTGQLANQCNGLSQAFTRQQATSLWVQMDISFTHDENPS